VRIIKLLFDLGMKAVLTFKPAGWFSKDLHRVEGFLIDARSGVDYLDRKRRRVTR
jgi:hypothetical protein